MIDIQTIKLGGAEYVILAKEEFQRLGGTAGAPAGAVDAAEYARESIGRSLRAARGQVGLTQGELAKKLGKSQPMVSGAESGRVNVSERYVAAVLKACGLPADWKARKARTPATRGSTGKRARNAVKRRHARGGK
jgi:ribosome-binding protein aMBF1 (putative translation factor)